MFKLFFQWKQRGTGYSGLTHFFTNFFGKYCLIMSILSISAKSSICLGRNVKIPYIAYSYRKIG